MLSFSLATTPSALPIPYGMRGDVDRRVANEKEGTSPSPTTIFGSSNGESYATGSPNSASMASRRFHLARRSERVIEPTLR